MKYLLLTNIGDRNLTDVFSLIKEEDPDTLLFAGNAATVAAWHQLHELATHFTENRSDAMLVPGNIDHAILHNTNPPFEHVEHPVEWVHTHLKQYPEIAEYLEQIIGFRDLATPTRHSRHLTLNPDTFKQAYTTLLVHGGITGTIPGFEQCPPGRRDLWYELPDMEHRRRTIETLQEHGFHVMIRGNNLEPRYTTRHEGAVTTDTITETTTVTLHANQQHITTIGAYRQGWCAILDATDTAPRLTFHRI